eukprot:361222-Ditylum_brightwellii.AAC.1
MALEHPSPASKIITPGRSLAESLTFSYMITDMSTQLGDESTPCQALRMEHIIWNQQDRTFQWSNTTDMVIKYQLALAQFFKPITWLGWLCSKEALSIHIQDVKVTEPKDSPSLGLAKGVGCVQLHLKD